MLACARLARLKRVDHARGRLCAERAGDDSRTGLHSTSHGFGLFPRREDGEKRRPGAGQVDRRSAGGKKRVTINGESSEALVCHALKGVVERGDVNRLAGTNAGGERLAALAVCEVLGLERFVHTLGLIRHSYRGRDEDEPGRWNVGKQRNLFAAALGEGRSAVQEKRD